ncbi:MAG: hypothetical protein C4529_02895 [Deltaproteobacteria bacterium]|nr:MAG: hypothetical protein C4529_02895 [Deltaproteobacteria bacterium]
MRIKGSLVNTAVRSLAQSMNVHTMENLARRLIRTYDLNERTGFPPSIPIPNLDAARQIINDMNDGELFPQFINLLVEISTKGWMGKKYDIAYLKELVKEIKEHGFIYDPENKLFIEDPAVRRTRNWGVLREGQDCIFTFLRFDIVGNSELVRKYPGEVIDATYNDFGDIVKRSLNRRNGRIWSWEGDGGLIAFYFSSKNQMATLCAMEILHELFLYNRLSCRLDEPLLVRMAVHGGNCDYMSSEEEIKKLDPVKKTIEYESKYTAPNTLTVSGVIHATLDDIAAREFTPISSSEKMKLYSYRFAG